MITEEDRIKATPRLARPSCGEMATDSGVIKFTDLSRADAVQQLRDGNPSLTALRVTGACVCVRVYARV